MILSDKMIRSLAINQSMLAPFDEHKLQAVSYDISSGNVAVVYKPMDRPIDLRNEGLVELVTRKVDITNGYHIKPNEYVLVKTKERFSMPVNMTAHIRPRTTFTKLGLTLSDQHMNPRFQGYLYLGLYNATPNIIDIYPDLTIAQMVFEEIAGEITEEKLYDHKKDAKYQNEDDFIAPKYDNLDEHERANIDSIVNKMLGKKDV
ncbi:dCTP deaminase [Selenomonas bovis]|uniref:dCTP deaminase n=1 Tax=Selenomonas bovis TaxID=416586 RepID=UPI003CFBDC80